MILIVCSGKSDYKQKKTIKQYFLYESIKSQRGVKNSWLKNKMFFYAARHFDSDNEWQHIGTIPLT